MNARARLRRHKDRARPDFRVKDFPEATMGYDIYVRRDQRRAALVDRTSRMTQRSRWQRAALLYRAGIPGFGILRILFEPGRRRRPAPSGATAARAAAAGLRNTGVERRRPAGD